MKLKYVLTIAFAFTVIGVMMFTGARKRGQVVTLQASRPILTDLELEQPGEDVLAYSNPATSVVETTTKAIPVTTIPPTTTPPVATAPVQASGSVWDALAMCETGAYTGSPEWDYGPHSNWGSKKFHGGLQFHPTTWTGFGGTAYAPYAYQATREQQIAVAEKVLASQGWGAWPHCSAKLGLR